MKEKFFSKKGKRLLAAGLVLGLLLSMQGLSVVMATDRIDTDKDASLTVAIDSEMWPEFKTSDDPASTFNVKLYKVAAISETGTFEATENFKDLAESLTAVKSSTTASDWADLADKAYADVTESMDAKTITVKQGTSEKTTLGQGLYLIVVDDEVMTENFVYTFTPYLVSVPNDPYLVAGDEGISKEGDDVWDYDVTTMLKPESEPRKGELTITKTLDKYDPILGTPTFVFEVKGTLEGETVYSNVVSLTFGDTTSAPASKSVTITDLPYGAHVTVTEVYNSPGYKLVSADGVQADIVKTDDTYPTVSFENTSTSTRGYGGSVTNMGQYDGTGFSGEQLTDNEGIVGTTTQSVGFPD